MIKRPVSYSFAALLVLVGLGVLWLQSQVPAYRDAFLYAYGPYEFTRSMQDLSAQRASSKRRFDADAARASYPEWTGGPFLNRHIHNTRLADHTLRSVTTPNNDTLYTSAVLELSNTPVEVLVPAVGSRYLSVAFMDIFNDQFEHIGPGETSGDVARYWVLGPRDNTEVPEGVTEIRAPGNDVWLLARIFVAGHSDLSAAQAAQQGIVVRPVNADSAPNHYGTTVTQIGDSSNFLQVVSEVFKRNRDHPQLQRLASFKPLEFESWDEMGTLNRLMWSLVTPRAESAIAQGIEERVDDLRGWSSPPPNIGFYQDDDLTRSAIALAGFGALRAEHALYYRLTRTADGALLDGTATYKITIPQDAPANAFWSLALYEIDETGRFFFYQNPAGRHSLNSASEGLSRDEDGNVVITMGPTADNQPVSSWMPTPEGNFAAFFRLYLPTLEALTTGWTPPDIIRQ